MSLKAFHIIFVTAATLLCFGFGVWAIKHFASGEGSGTELGLGIGSVVLGCALIVYGRYFLRKLRHVSYL